MNLTWSNRLDADDKVVAVLKGDFNFTKVDGYANFSILYGMLRMHIARKRTNIAPELLELYNWYLGTLTKFIAVPEFDYTSESYTAQSAVFERVPDLAVLSTISVDYTSALVGSLGAPRLVLRELDEDDIQAYDRLYDGMRYDGILFEQQYLTYVVTEQMHQLSIPCSLDSTSDKARSLGKQPCKSKYGCHIEVVQALNMLMQSFIYFNNSSSMSKGIYFDYDRFELGKRNELVGLMMKRIQGLK